MDLVPIGEAARLLGVKTSALRYYEDRGLVRPHRKAGQRQYSRTDLRRLAFVQITRRLGLSLDTAAAVLNDSGEQWRDRARDQVRDLAGLIAQAQEAQLFLAHALECPAEHPVRDCPRLVAILDRRLDGATLEQLASEHAGHTEHAGH